MKKLNLEYIYEYQAKQYSFMQLPMLLITGEEFRELDYGCKILYGLLLSRVSLSLNAKNRDKFMDEKGRIFILFSSKEIADKMKCSRRSAVKYIRLLEEYGLIELREENGYSSKIFVKDFAGVQNNTSKETESSVNEAERTYAKVAYPPMQSLHTPLVEAGKPCETYKKDTEEEIDISLKEQEDLKNKTADISGRAENPLISSDIGLNEASEKEPIEPENLEETLCDETPITSKNSIYDKKMGEEAEGTRAKVAYPPMQSLHTPRAKFAHPNKIDRKIYKDSYIYNKQKNPSITQEVYRGLGKRKNIDLSKAEYNAIINDFGNDRGRELIDIVSDKIFSRGKENEKIRYIYPYIKKVAESLGYMELSQIKKDVVITENNLNSYYLELRRKAKDKESKALREVNNIPEIQKLNRELKNLYIQKMIAKTKGKSKEYLEQFAKDIALKNQKKKLLYQKYGIDEENFKAKFICDKCNDTGYVKGSMEPCSCRADRERELKEKILRRKLQEGI